MYNNPMITNIDIDDEVVAEAMKVSGARTKREVVDRALREMVARARRPAFRDLRGIGGIDPGYDPKAPDGRNGGGEHRVEQPRPGYKARSKAAKA
jgi:Arc/MetJ family transcription regulator